MNQLQCKCINKNNSGRKLASFGALKVSRNSTAFLRFLFSFLLPARSQHHAALTAHVSGRVLYFLYFNKSRECVYQQRPAVHAAFVVCNFLSVVPACHITSRAQTQ